MDMLSLHGAKAKQEGFQTFAELRHGAELQDLHYSSSVVPAWQEQASTAPPHFGNTWMQGFHWPLEKRCHCYGNTWMQ